MTIQEDQTNFARNTWDLWSSKFCGFSFLCPIIIILSFPRIQGLDLLSYRQTVKPLLNTFWGFCSPIERGDSPCPRSQEHPSRSQVFTADARSRCFNPHSITSTSLNEPHDSIQFDWQWESPSENRHWSILHQIKGWLRVGLAACFFLILNRSNLFSQKYQDRTAILSLPMNFQYELWRPKQCKK